VFHADGTGTVNDRSISVTVPPFSAGSDEVSLQFTYTIGPDGKLSIALVPGTYKATNLTGPAAGLTAVEEIPVLTGFIGEGARTIVLGEAAPTVELATVSNGVQLAKVCTRSRTLIRISDDDR
jgi:hypothetical protein